MRTTLTLILRLLVDSNEPEALRGAIQAVSSKKEHTFNNGQSLLEWLRIWQKSCLEGAPESPQFISDEDVQKGVQDNPSRSPTQEGS